MMHYVVSYTTPFGNPVISLLDANEYGTLLVPCQVMYKSENFEEASFYYHEMIK